MDPRPAERASGIRSLRTVILDRVRRMRAEASATVGSVCAASNPLRVLVGRRWRALAAGMLLLIVLRARGRRSRGSGPDRLL
ncbi:MAG: hypothetical protein N0A24_02155 [Armatimonadetes bacterium]|nr:hypothetical protein [Armatimonadota bacterium]MDW8153017.1 hypothetical protein [Armatimonadota bacterium]